MTPVYRSPSTLWLILFCAGTGCLDLDVQNPNAPDADRALATPGDVEALIGGAYGTWLRVHWYGGPTMFLSVASGEHGSPWACCGMEHYGRIPRVPSANRPGGSDVYNLTYAWTQCYRVIAPVRDGLKRIEDGAVDLGADELRAKAYGKFMQGLSHGTIALLYDSGFVYDETIDPATDEVPLQGYSAVMSAALGYLDEAITLVGGATFTIPETWMSQEVSSATLVQLAHSWKAQFRTAVARTPAERAAVNWDAVVADANNGVTEDWDVHSQCWPHVFCDEAIMYRVMPGWQMQNNWVAGMADVSGQYQAWINTPLLDKQPFIIVTPDTRWPRGTTEAEQLAAPGEYYTMNTGSSRVWSRPDRGTWRWSYYYQTYEPFFSVTVNDVGDLPQVKVREMKALAAEKAYIDGDMASVAAFVNETRTLHGLQATDAAGTNTDCVPRLPRGDCGDLWEMFKWEKRLETQFAGPIRSGWYFDGRGWGDLIEGTILQFPVPYREMELLEQPAYNLGGVGGEWGAPKGTYEYDTPVPQVAKVVVTPATADLALLGDTVQLTASAQDAQGNVIAFKKWFRWWSSDESVATVSSSGLVTAIGSGAATITAETDGVSGSASVTVESAPASTVTVTPDTASVTSLGQTVQLTAVARDANGDAIPGKTFTWSSSDGSIAMVSSSGLVTPVGIGEATITATADGVSGSALVTVQIPPLVVVTPAGISISGMGATHTFGTEAWDAYGNPIPSPTVTWSSLNPLVATIDDGGTATAVASGQTTIAAELDGGVGYALVTVSVPGVAPATAWQADSVTNRSLTAVWGASASDVIVVGGSAPIHHYDGTSWSAMTVWEALLWDVWGTASGDVFSVGGIGEGILHYDGAQWTRITTPSRGLSGVWGASPADVLAVGAYGLTLRFDGTEWHLLTASTGDYRDSLDDLWGTSHTNVFAVGWGGTVLHYDGSTWASETSGTDKNLQGVWGTSWRDVFAVGSDGTILHHDGIAWRAMTSGTGAHLMSVWGTSSDDVYAVGSNGTILHYNGTAWSPMTSGTDVMLHGVWCTSSGDVVVVGDDGVILRGQR